jgi:hypothetical protein
VKRPLLLLLLLHQLAQPPSQLTMANQLSRLHTASEDKAMPASNTKGTGEPAQQLRVIGTWMQPLLLLLLDLLFSGGKMLLQPLVTWVY